MSQRILLVTALFLLLPATGFAHPGRTDASGCHTCRTNCPNWGLSTGEYHCHNAKALPQPEEPIRSHYGEDGTGTTEPWPEYEAPIPVVSEPTPVKVEPVKVVPQVEPVKVEVNEKEIVATDTPEVEAEPAPTPSVIGVQELPQKSNWLVRWFRFIF